MCQCLFQIVRRPPSNWGSRPYGLVGGGEVGLDECHRCSAISTIRAVGRTDVYRLDGGLWWIEPTAVCRRRPSPRLRIQSVLRVRNGEARAVRRKK